jgi:hypothetical protein
MKFSPFVFIAMCSFFILTTNVSFASAVPSYTSPVSDSQWIVSSLNLIKKQSNKTIEKQLGRRLTGKEKIGLWAVRRLQKVDEAKSKKADSQALIGFLCSLAGIFFIPLFGSIAAVILTSSALKMEKAEPGTLKKNKDLAQIGFVIGIVGLALAVVAIILVVAYLSAFSR